MSARAEVSVLGAGNWGCTVANLIARNGHDVVLWCRRDEQRDEINNERTNRRYLPDIRLSEKIRATTDLEEAVRGVPMIFNIVPSKAFRDTCRAAGELLRPDQYVVHGTKGIEPKSFKRMTQILAEETCIRQLGVLSGPNIALEMARGKPAGTVIASRFPRVIAAGRRFLVSEQLRVYSNDDVVGVEFAGTLKNVIAIAAGMAREMDMGENAKALLVTRGLSEIARLGVALGARPMTFAGVAGIGDLMVTCESSLSRNNRLGAALARGQSVEEAVASLGMVAEGVNASLVARAIIRERGIDAPLLEMIYRMVHEGLNPTEAIRELMTLSSRHDVDRALSGE